MSISTTTTRSTQQPTPRFYHAQLFWMDFVYDGYQRLIVAQDMDEAKRAASTIAPHLELDLHIEEIAVSVFEDLLDIYEDTDPDENWVIVINSRQHMDA